MKVVINNKKVDKEFADLKTGDVFTWGDCVDYCIRNDNTLSFTWISGPKAGVNDYIQNSQKIVIIVTNRCSLVIN